MAGPCSLAAGLLLLALCALHTVPAGSVRVPPSCCLTFISKKIPQNRVVGYQLASRSVCPKEGVIFTTRKGQKFCADPKLPWVQKYMKNLDARQRKGGRKNQARGHQSARSQTPCRQGCPGHPGAVLTGVCSREAPFLLSASLYGGQAGQGVLPVQLDSWPSLD